MVRLLLWERFFAVDDSPIQAPVNMEEKKREDSLAARVVYVAKEIFHYFQIVNISSA